MDCTGQAHSADGQDRQPWTQTHPGEGSTLTSEGSGLGEGSSTRRPLRLISRLGDAQAGSPLAHGVVVLCLAAVGNRLQVWLLVGVANCQNWVLGNRDLNVQLHNAGRRPVACSDRVNTTFTTEVRPYDRAACTTPVCIR